MKNDKPSRSRAVDAVKELGGVLLAPLTLDESLVEALLSKRSFLDMCQCSVPFGAGENVGDRV